VLVIHNSQILGIRKNEDGNIRYILPGGRQEWGESFEEALERECLEEIGVKPNKINKIALVGERYYSTSEAEHHLTYIVFDCELPDILNAKPLSPDKYQEGIEWLNIHDLEKVPFAPKELGKAIIQYYNNGMKEMIFAGMMNG